MSDVRAALRAYVTTDEPPIGLRGPEIIAAGRRARRNRRLATAGGALLVASLLAAGLVTVPRTWIDEPVPRADGFAALPPCPQRPGPRPATPVAPNQPIPDDVLAWALPTVTCYLADRVPAMLPEARFAPVPGANPGFGAGPLEAFSVGGPTWYRMDAMALVRDDDGTGDLSVIVSVADPAVMASRRDNCAGARECTLITVDGATIMVWPNTRMPEFAFTSHVVEVFRGRTNIGIQSANANRTSVDGTRPKATRLDPVLTPEQLTELALGSELLLFP